MILRKENSNLKFEAHMNEAKLLFLTDRHETDKIYSGWNMRRRTLEEVKFDSITDIDEEIDKALDLEKMSIESSEEVKSFKEEEDDSSPFGDDKEEDFKVEDNEPPPTTQTEVPALEAGALAADETPTTTTPHPSEALVVPDSLIRRHETF
ncbi:hypothetical protein K7X08_017016 [Anisodus acutangulus]|uniref:Uncharacterized protein n=1 Tax=Anisodus acutangulus TaxID=402998 RepID=A0A9Q1R6G1_9SOLA|nr:hypothetical protein K7X08_017016 [Anisodus acutangulus]